MNIPNSLTIARIVIIPVFVTSIMYNQYLYALILFVIAALTDLLDGLLARLANQKTPLGTFLDPLADKFLLVSSFIIFSVNSWIPKWFTIIVISRDLIVVIGCFLLYMLTSTIKIEPVFLGKLAIALQLFILAYVLLNVNITTLPPVHDLFFILSAALTALSGLQYIYKGFKLTNAL
ncbi:MAG: CDP-alcohol phosphatidyltransferase family protein [Nitrospirota bacterium]|nr:CDP-alcohol phosphatidyltransferase family protein [Nitrospirota bacterium]